MAERLAELGLHPLDDVYAPLSTADVEALESQLGVALPEDYREYLNCYGVAVFDGSVQCLPIDPRGRQFEVSLFLGGVRTFRNPDSTINRRRKPDGDAVSKNLKRLARRIPSSMIPIATSNSNFICLGVSGEDRGKVFFWNHELEAEQATTDDELRRATTLAAATFTEFLAGLRDPERDQWLDEPAATERPESPMVTLGRLRAGKQEDASGAIGAVYLDHSLLLQDADLESLAQLPNLICLSLSNTRVGNAGMGHLGKLRSLRSLDIDNCRRVSGPGFRTLSGLTSLESLTVSLTAFADADLPVLAELPCLESLELFGTSVTDVGMRELLRLPQLKRLGLSRTRISDAGLEALGQLTNIEALSLNDSSVSDDGLRYLSELTQLKELHVAGTRVSDNSLDRLKELLPKSQI